MDIGSAGAHWRGDDTGQGNSISLDAARDPGILHVTLYRYREEHDRCCHGAAGWWLLPP